MIDGIVLGDYTVIVVMGVTEGGYKIIIGARIGSTENAQVCKDLLADVVHRGLLRPRPVYDHRISCCVIHQHNDFSPVNVN